MNPLSELVLFRTAAALYTAATASAFVYLGTRRDSWSRWMLRLLGTGAALHLLAFVLRIAAFWADPGNRFLLPINSFFGALSFLSLAVALAFFQVEVRHRLGILGAFVLPWACAAAWGGVWRTFSVGSTEIAALPADLQSRWMNFHPAVLMASYALLANAFGVGVALLVQEGQVKSRRPSDLCYSLPAIEELDALNYRLVAAALPVFALGVLLGGFWAHGAWGRFWGWDAKETWALITALVYGVFLRQRAVAGWRGRKAVYVSMFGFACALFTFLGVNFLSQLHGYLTIRRAGAGLPHGAAFGGDSGRGRPS